MFGLINPIKSNYEYESMIIMLKVSILLSLAAFVAAAKPIEIKLEHRCSNDFLLLLLLLLLLFFPLFFSFLF